jgi:hypothetical protein
MVNALHDNSPREFFRSNESSCDERLMGAEEIWEFAASVSFALAVLASSLKHTPEFRVPWFLKNLIGDCPNQAQS